MGKDLNNILADIQNKLQDVNSEEKNVYKLSVKKALSPINWFKLLKQNSYAL